MFYLTKVILYFVSTDVDLKESFKKMYDSMTTKLNLNPNVFHPAVQKMVANYQKINWVTQLASAMHTLGKFTSVMAL